jgi:hypothetical protein
MSEKSETSFDYMAVFALSGTVLLMCVGARYSMHNTKVREEFVELNVLATPIRLNMYNFMIQKTLNMPLELKEHLKYIRFLFEEIQPCKTTIGINKTDIIFVSTNRNLGRTPHIRMN